MSATDLELARRDPSNIRRRKVPIRPDGPTGYVQERAGVAVRPCLRLSRFMSFRGQSSGLDPDSPFRDLVLDEFCKIVLRAVLQGHHIGADFFQAFLNLRRTDRRVSCITQFRAENRTLTPVAQLFTDYARNLAKARALEK